MLHHFQQHHHFFRHKEINEIYLSVFLMHLADGMISIFIPIYLYSLHYSLLKIILFCSLGNLFSVLISWPAIKIIGRLGAKHSMIISTPFLIIYYLGLRALPSYPYLFFLLPLIIAIRSAFYNYSFGWNFVTHSNKQKIGSNISAMELFVLLASILSPLIAGLIITQFGYGILFGFGSILLLLSIAPMLYSKEIYQQVDFKFSDIAETILNKKQRGLNLSFVGYAIESNIGRIIWPLFLIIMFSTVEKVGYVVALSTLLTIIVIAMTGKFADNLKSKKLLRLGTAFYFFGWLGSAFADSSLAALFADSYRRLAWRFVSIPWEATFYRQASIKKYLLAELARDLVFNGSRVLFLPILLLIFTINFYPFTVAFILASVFVLLYPFAVGEK